jgi:hypothetical protein
VGTSTHSGASSICIMRRANLLILQESLGNELLRKLEASLVIIGRVSVLRKETVSTDTATPFG